MRISDWSSDVCSSDLHTHTKKGFQMFIAIMGARVERETFAALLDAARALGGWYTKPWGGTPGGFAFKDAAMARQFVAAHGEGDATQPPSGETRAPAATRRSEATTSEIEDITRNQ